MQNFHSIAWFYWDPPTEVFRIPFLDHPIMWYGILFVSGFILGYFLIISVFKRLLQEPSITCSEALPSSLVTSQDKSYFLADRLCWFLVLGTLIGARLGAVFFYNWDYFRDHPLEIIKVWKGGLASHGGILGIIAALYFYRLYIKHWVPGLTFLRLMDCVAIPGPLAGCFIRLGNFMNQEIVGIPTSLPWAVLFAHPMDGIAPVPRHPVQLYEAFSYLAIFFILYRIWVKKGESLQPGALAGLLLILIFSSRFFIEFWKERLESPFAFELIQAGQLLSLPFILLGFYLFLRQNKQKIYKNG